MYETPRQSEDNRNHGDGENRHEPVPEDSALMDGFCSSHCDIGSPILPPRPEPGTRLGDNVPVTSSTAPDNLVANQADSEADASRLPRLLAEIKDKLNPRLIAGRFGEAIAAIRSLPTKDEDRLVSDPEGLRAHVNAKLLAGFVLSELVGTYIGSPVGSLIGQYSADDPVYGILGSIVGDYFPALFTGVATWAFLSRDYYKSTTSSLIGRGWAVAKDMAPFVGMGLAVSSLMYPIDGAIAYGTLELCKSMAPEMAQTLPAASYASIINITIGEAIYVVFAGASLVGLSGPLTERYRRYLEKKRQESPEAET